MTNEINTASEGYLTITYDINGGTPEIPSAEVYYGQSYTIPDTYLQKESHNFIMWVDSETNEEYIPGNTYTIQKDLNLEAVFRRVYFVSYNLNGGDGENPLFLIEEGGYHYITSEIPTKRRHTFLHWVDESGNIYTANDEILPTSDVGLIAVWKENEIYNITFDVDGGTPEIPSASVYEGEEYTLPEIYPEKEGYYFIYWNDEVNNIGYSPNETITVEKDIALKAFYRRISSITFDLNGGEGDFPVLSEMDTIFITLPEAVPTKPGHRFLHWVNLDGEIYEAGGTYIMKPTDDTLTAVWYELKLCTITYDVDGGTPEIPSVSVYEGESCTVPDIYPEKDGYQFVYWYDEVNEISITPNETFTVEKSLNFKAVFYRISSITFDLNGGEGNFPVLSEMDTIFITLPEAVPTKLGHRFLHWVNLDGEFYEAGGTYIMKPTDDTLTAVWYELKLYTITFDVDGGTPEIPSVSVYEGESYTLPEIYPEKEGYYFIYWNDEANNIGYSSISTITVEKDIALKAFYRRISSITFDLNGGEGDFPVLSEMDTIFITLPEAVPTKPGHRFLHWVNLDGEIYEAGGTYIMKPTDDTLTAVWQELKLCTITFDVDGGTPEIPSVSVYEGESYTVSDVIPQKEGYYFTYWKDSETAAGYTPKESFIISKDITLKAVWTPNPYLVTYDAGEEQPFHSEYVEVGMSTSVISCIPEKEGYSFLNWSDGNGDTYVSGDSFTPASDTKLTAVWSCTLHFDLDGGVGENASITKEEGDYIVLTDIPTREGYDFDGFENKNGEYYSRYVFNKGEDTLRAIWKEKKYPVTYDLNGGEGSFPEQEKRHTEPLTLHAGVPTKEGTQFFAWESDDGRRFSPNDVYNTNEALHLTAVWENEVTYTITYDLAGGEGEFSMQTKAFGESIIIHSTVPARGSDVFLHWKDEEENIYNPGEVYEKNASLCLTAVWKKKYTVTYLDANGNVFSTQTKFENEEISLIEETPEKSEEYGFLHWRSSYSNEVYFSKDLFNENADVTLTPEYEELYMLVFWEDDSTCTFVYKTKNVPVPVEVAPSKSGYEFVCWKLRPRNEYYLAEEPYSVDESTGFEAVWARSGTISVVYDTRYGEGEYDVVSTSANNIKISSAIPTRKGYIFKGWTEVSTDELNSPAQNDLPLYLPGETYSFDTSKRLLAVWEKDIPTTVSSFDIGRYGEGNIDIRTGNLILNIEDLALLGERMPTEIFHCYNRIWAGKKYTYDELSGINSADFSQMNVGLGFKLNVMQSIKKVNKVHSDGVVSKYVYVNAEGNETYFILDEEKSDLEDEERYFVYKEKDGGDMTYTPETRKMTVGNEEYLFDKKGRLVSVTDEFGNTKTVVYTDDKITSVVDGVGRAFTFEYSGKDLSVINAPDGTRVRFYYTDGYLTKIILADLTSLVIAYSGQLLEKVSLYKNDETFICERKYADIGLNNFIFDKFGLEGETSVRSNHLSFACYPDKNYTSVAYLFDKDYADDLEKETVTTVYTFDNDGNLINRFAKAKRLTSGEMEYYPNGSFSDDGKAIGKGINYSDNRLKSHSCRALSYWSCTTEEPSINVLAVSFEGQQKTKYAQSALQITSTDELVMKEGVFQSVSLPAGEYTFSAYVRIQDDFLGINPGTYLSVSTATGTLLSESEIINENEELHTRLATSFTLTQTTTVNVFVNVNGKGTVFVNALQLEKNSFATPYNMLENGSFENGDVSWNKPSGTYITTGEAFQGTRSMASTGSGALKNISQDVFVKDKNSTRETFVFSGWAYTEGITTDKDSVLRLRAVITYADDGIEPRTEEFISDFNPNVADWQYASLEFCKTQFRGVEKITVYCDFKNTEGVVYFDALSLTRSYLELGLKAEDFDPDYEGETEDTESSEEVFEEVIDVYGNVLTETTFSDDLSEGTFYRAFEYSENGNELVKEIDERGNETLYTYEENTSRQKTVTDREGRKTVYTYDGVGRTTSTTDFSSLASVSYYYDPLDNLTEIRRGDGMQYNLSYGTFRDLEGIGIEGKDENLVSYTYRKNSGRLKKIAYANGDYMKASYNMLGQMISEKWYGENDTLKYEYVYSYDNEGNVVRTIDSEREREYNYLYEDGNLVGAYEYDTSTSPKTRLSAIIYTYDESGKLKKKKVSTADGEQKYSYTEEGNTARTSLESFQASYVASTVTDGLGRRIAESVATGSSTISRSFTYLSGSIPYVHRNFEKVKGAATTNLVSRITYSDGRTISYEYDKEERITKVTDSAEGVTEYIYDKSGQLLCEKYNGTDVNVMTYDKYGNILTKNGKTYNYSNAYFKDLLTSVDGTSITYDEQGNPTVYLGNTLVWEKGRQLKSFGNNLYEYNANGVRISKTVNGVKHSFILDGTKILEERYGENVIVPLYDTEESLCGISYNNTSYYFMKNLQGDVIAIVDNAGATVARYDYDAWGKCTIVFDTTSENIASVNPFRYRSYYYDSETSLYYLQSRYYDPEVGRFLNADDAQFSIINELVLSHNLFSYCYNSPIVNSDTTGYIAHNVVGAVVGVFMSLGTYFLGVLMGFDTFSWWSLLWAVVGGAASGAFGASVYKRAIQVIFNIIDSVAVNVISCLKKAKVTLEQVVQEVFIGAIVGLISGLVGGNGNGKLFKKASNQYVKKWLSRNKNLIIKGTKYYIKSFAKLLKQKVVKPVFMAFMAGMITNTVLRKKFERLLA